MSILSVDPEVSANPGLNLSRKPPHPNTQTLLTLLGKDEVNEVRRRVGSASAIEVRKGHTRFSNIIIIL
jgi:hypothetical protein